ncbi:uncharacterized protein SPSK_00456 [Sporothrix schenckii 1099-18]|uniref:Uncharacterized protein n=2 Tax=Sporothrix schenckii TaxID=29908 RepID=U7Q693_SPOS1|nr:uncharacterized protein SPSK_00456 [Sporothrix schenckii 1099-18]ERT02717.1 hypothetical protein HMPREF1624_01018 [Sporothrix schenckii ATCC 58251]KJR79969.1 hypothetical protein SPSK_00456 [Sporothrix schenckii 1099-18]
MVGPRAPLGKLADHLKGILSSQPTETTAPKMSLSDLKNGSKSAAFDDSDDESSDSDSGSSGSDSDDDNKSSFLRKISHTNAAAASPVPTKSPTKPNGTSVRTPTLASKPAAKTNGTAMKKTAVKDESSGSDEDSEESSSDDSDDDSESSSDGSESDSESDEEDEGEAPKTKAGKTANTKTTSKPVTTAPSTSTSSSAATSSSSSRSASVENSESKGGEEEDESENEAPVADGAVSDEEMADQSFAIDTRKNSDNQVGSNPRQFVTQGFELRRADESNDASDVARVFRQAKLEGKQLWYFTAPSSVPITVVEKMAIPVEKAQQGKAILNHNGEDYGMSFDDALTSKTIKLLIPNKAGDKYSILDRTIDKTMHLKRVTRFSQGDEEVAANAAMELQAPVASKKQPRKQPEGLRARYLPIGVNDTVNSSKKRKHEGMTAVAAPAAATVDSGDDSDGGAAVKISKNRGKDAEGAAEPSPKKARKDKSAEKETETLSKKDKKSASAVPLPPIPGLAAVPVHKVTPVAPPVLPSSSQPSYSHIDTPSKITVDNKIVSKKNKDKKRAVADVDADAMDIDDDEDAAPAESSPEKKKKKDKKDKSEKSEKKERKGKKEQKEKDKKDKKERKASKAGDDSVSTPAAGLTTSAPQPKKVTPVPLPRIN